MVKGWAQGSLIISIVLVALASLVLGMGPTVTAAYIVLGTLSAPARPLLPRKRETRSQWVPISEIWY